MNWYTITYELHYQGGTKGKIIPIRPPKTKAVGDSPEEAIEQFFRGWTRKKKPQNVQAVFLETLEASIERDRNYTPSV